MSGWNATIELLREPRISVFLAGRALAAMGIWLERIGLTWLVWELTGSAGWVGVLAFVRLMPTLVLTPLGGVLADRIGGVAILLQCFVGAALVAACMAALLFAGAAGLWAVLGIGVLAGALQAVATGPMKSVLSEVAPRHRLATIVPLGSVTFNLAGFVGPALAGVLIATVGTASVFVLAAATSVAFVGALACFRNPPRRTASRGRVMTDFFASVRTARSDPVIAPLMLLHVAFALLLRPVIDLLPVIAGTLADGDAEALGLFGAALGLGALVGSLWLTWRSGGLSGAPKALSRRILAGGAVATVAAVALALSSWAIQAALCLCILGGALVVRGAGGNTLVQLTVADAERGRVMSLWGMVLRLGSALGGLILGIAAEVFGLRMVLIAAAIIAGAVLFPVARALTGALASYSHKD